MNIYYVYQDENTSEGTYHAMVVSAESLEKAKKMHPAKDWGRTDVWCYSEEEVSGRLLGKAKKDAISEIILSSYS
tara:strand:- start:7102 stop:7326 length:225 start_codon:yes stop_codon:yes gene_type:complete